MNLKISILKIDANGSSTNHSSTDSKVNLKENDNDVLCKANDVLRKTLEDAFTRDKYPLKESGRYIVYAGDPSFCYAGIFDVEVVPSPKIVVTPVTESS